MPILREERLKPKSDKEHSLPLLNFLALKIAENVLLFWHFPAETRCVQQGHHPGIANYIWFILLLSLVYQQAQSYYCGMKAHINSRREPLTKILSKKTNFKKLGFSTMTFTAKILSWRFRHLNIVGCLLKRRPTKGGSRAPQDPPSYASDIAQNMC